MLENQQSYLILSLPQQLSLGEEDGIQTHACNAQRISTLINKIQNRISILIHFLWKKFAKMS